MKFCSKCKVEKPEDEFNIRIGSIRRGVCKDCQNLQRRNWYRSSDSRFEIIRKVRIYKNERAKGDEVFRIIEQLRWTVLRFLKYGSVNSKRIQKYLKCTNVEFRTYIQSKFDKEMTWQNQGTYWHLDHIIPISTAKTVEEVKILCHYTNYQPLKKEDNYKKKNKGYR